MEYVLYAVSAIFFGLSIFLFTKRKASARIYMLMAIDIAEKAAKMTKTQLDDKLVALLKKAICDSVTSEPSSILDQVKINEEEEE